MLTRGEAAAILAATRARKGDRAGVMDGQRTSRPKRRTGRNAMKLQWKSKIAAACLAGALGLGALSGAAQAEEKYKIFLSMSYIGNDWQAEAAHMIKAMALSKTYRDKVDLQVQVAGPSA